jgi:molybdopterin-guanine dinucleotide biosynthesis protein A
MPARGPLLGVLAALEWAAEAGADWVVTAPCDAPLLPGDLASRLISAAEAQGASAAYAATSSGAHPLSAIWSRALAPRLRELLSGADHPAAHEVTPDAVRVVFEDENAFANINTPGDFARISAAVRSHP